MTATTSPVINVRRGRMKRVLHEEAALLFNGVTAWFSSSVSHETKVAWIKHGGLCGDWKEATMLFSEDRRTRDTMELFEQMEFLWGYVTIFHASFISACIQEKNMKNLAIAPYLMLPPDYPLLPTTSDVPGCNSAQLMASRTEEDDEQPEEMMRELLMKRKRRRGFSNKAANSLPPTAEKIHSNTYSKYQDPCGSCEKSFQFCNGVEESYSENHMPLVDLSSIPHVNSLRQSSMILSDFIPLQYGCSVRHKV